MNAPTPKPTRASHKTKAKPSLNVVGTSASNGKIIALSARESDVVQFRDEVVARAGFVSLGCGCFIRMDPRALNTLSAQTIVDAACHSAGTCKHPRPH